MEKNKFDLNTLLGFLLIGGILIYFSYFNLPENPAPATASEGSDTIEQVEESMAPTATAAKVSPDSALADSQSTAGLRATYGPFAPSMLAKPKADTLRIENDVLRLAISAKGGQIVSAELKKFRRYDSLPLHLIKDNSQFQLFFKQAKRWSSTELNFSGEQISDRELRFRLQADNGAYLDYLYRLPETGYMVDWQVQSSGMAGLLDDEKRLLWEQKAFRNEKNRDYEQQRSEIHFRIDGTEKVDDISTSSATEEDIEEDLHWIAYREQFFSSVLLLRNGAWKNSFLALRSTEDEDFTKYKLSSLEYPLTSAGELDLDMGLYLGPNKYEILNSYEEEFEQLLPLGWGILGWINRGLVIPIFNWLEHYGLNYGLIILIIALIFKMILFPLTYTSYRSMAKTRVLKPELDALNEKYDDAMQKQQATMELYRKAGVNPLGGCLPMLLQFPILIALFQFFPNSIELRQKSFLWADDLSSYDSILDLPFNIPFYGDHVSLFTLLMTVSTLIYTWMNQQMTGSAQNQQFPQMKYIIYLMPIMFLGVFNSYASGLSYYYFVANMITFGQQFAIRAAIDEDKIHAKIQERKKKPVKENRLMRRMQEMQDQQNRQARRRK